jgi:hypothetical protein
MIPIKSTDRTPLDIQELEEMVAKLLISNSFAAFSLATLFGKV